MPGWPDVAVESGGATPAVPVSSRTAGSPRHTGGEGVADTVGDRVRGGEGLRVAGGDGVGTGVRVELPDALRVVLPVPLALAVTLALGVPDGLRSDATLRPRYVSRDTASSPPPPPPAASHSADSSMPLS
jgi:hypothetical protein